MTDSPSPASQWLARFFEHVYRLNPVGATFVGEHVWDGRLPDYSPSAVEDAQARIVSLLTESSGLAVEALDEPERHDIRLAQGALRIQQWELSGRHFHRGNPSLYTGEAAFGLISLLLTDYAPVATRVDSAIERLAGLPRLMEQAVANVGSAHPEWVARADRECAGLLALLDDGLPRFADGVLGRHPRYAAHASSAREAVETYRAHLVALSRSGAGIDVSAGEEAFALHLREGHFLSEDAAEIERYARAELAEASSRLVEGAPGVGCSTPVEALARLKDHHPTAATYATEYQRVWDEARAVAADHGLVTWPVFPIRFVERPSWVRSAAPHLYFLFYRSPASVGSPAVHDYLIAPFDISASAETHRAFLEAQNDSVIKLNHVVHHGGLGHHVQNWHAFRATSRIGRMAAVDTAARIALLCGGTMAEGWACYATDLMSEAGFLTPLEVCAEQAGRARMCCRAIVDCRLHTGRWTLEQAARFYEEHALMSAAAARAEAVKNSMFPGAAVMYLMGRDAIHRLRAEMRAIEGAGFSLKRFHDTFLSYGSIPVSMIATSMTERARGKDG